MRQLNKINIKISNHTDIHIRSERRIGMMGTMGARVGKRLRGDRCLSAWEINCDLLCYVWLFVVILFFFELTCKHEERVDGSAGDDIGGVSHGH